jgi:hypothetical protein
VIEGKTAGKNLMQSERTQIGLMMVMMMTLFHDQAQQK